MTSQGNKHSLRAILLTVLLIISVFAGIPLTTTSAVAASGTITATDYTLVNDSGYTYEPLTASVTVNNTNDTQESKTITIQHYTDGRWTTVGEETVIVDANTTKTANVSYTIKRAPDDGMATLRVKTPETTLTNSTLPITRTPTHIQSVKPDTTSLETGNSTTVTATVRNYNESTAVDRELTLDWGNQSTTSQITKTVRVPAGASVDVEFTPTFTIPGVHAPEVRSTFSDPIRVNDPASSVELSNQTVLTQTLYTGETIRANATVNNTDTEKTTYSVVLVANTSARATQYATTTVSLNASESKNVTLSTWVSTAGDYTVSINRQDISTATVKRPYNATNLTVDESSVVGQKTAVSVNVTNRKSTQISRDITLEQYKSGYWTNLNQTSISLNGSETKTLTFTPAFQQAGEKTLRVGNSQNLSVTVKSTVNVSNVSVSTTDAFTREPVYVNATVTNRLDSETKTTLGLQQQYESSWYTDPSTEKTVSLNASETKNVSFRVVFTSDGEQTRRLGNTDPFTVSVTDTPVHVASTAVSERSIDPGNNTSVTATVRNHGSEGAEYQTVLKIDGGTDYGENGRELSKTVHVPAGDTKQVTFTPTFTVAGTHELKIGYEEAGTVSVSSTNVSVVSGAATSDTTYKRDSLPVEVTLNNTADTKKQFAVTVEGDKNTSEYYTVTNTTVVSVPANSETTTQLLVRPYSTGNYTVRANDKVVDAFQVKPGVLVKNLSFSQKVVPVGQPIYLNKTLRNPTGKDRTHFTQVAGNSHRTNVPKSATKDVSTKVEFSTPGAKRVWADGTTYTVYAVADTSGTANLSFKRVYTPDRIVNGSLTGFYAEVENTGNATGVKTVTLTLNGTAVANETVYVPAGQTQSVYLEHTFTKTGDFDGSLSIADGATRNFTGSVRSEVVVDDSVSVSHVAGTEPNQSPVAEAEYRSGSVYVELTQNGNYVRDLSALGADNTTAFNVSFLVTDYTPRIVVGSGHDLNLSVTNTSDPDTKRVSVRIKPGELDYKYNFAGERPASPSEWASAVENNTADYGWDTAVQFRVGNADTAAPSADASAAAGMTVSTDAQMFSMPRYVTPENSAPYLEVSLAAPHKTVEGEVNQGYYEAFLPNSLLNSWNVSDPSEELTASFQRQDLNMTVTETAEGAFVDISLHYSSGTLQIQKNTTATQPDDTDSTDNTNDKTNSDTTNFVDSPPAQETTTTQQSTTTTTTTTITTTTTTPTTTTTMSTVTTEDTATSTAESTTTDTTTSGATSATPTESGSSGSTPGFGLVLTVVAALCAGLLARRTH